jgi:hypothetical protein
MLKPSPAYRRRFKTEGLRLILWPAMLLLSLFYESIDEK